MTNRRELVSAPGSDPHGLWKVDTATAADKPEILDLFLEAFGQPMSGDLWDWKYGDGRGVATIARRDGRIIAHYGGIRRDVIYQRRPCASVQCVDTMVRPAERGTLSRRGPYFLVASRFLDCYVGYNRPFLFGFGFPNHRVMRLGEKVGIQASVGEILEPVWTTASENVLTAYDFDPENSRHRESVDRLWREMRQSLPDAILGVRDDRYIRHRYTRYPGREYKVSFLQSKGSGGPLGLSIVRMDGHRLWLLDLVTNVGNIPQLIGHARYQAGLLGAAELTAWITEQHLGLFGANIHRVIRPQVRIPTSVCTDGPHPDELRGKWWLTAGDTDFK